VQKLGWSWTTVFGLAFLGWKALRLEFFFSIFSNCFEFLKQSFCIRFV
jgi:hypothetical protein